MTDTLALVTSRIRTVLRRCPELDATTRAADIPDWDSFATVDIIFALEADLGFQMSSEEMERVDGVAALVTIIEARAPVWSPVT